MRYAGHTVYVVINAYPECGPVGCAHRPATRRDVERAVKSANPPGTELERLGVVSEGRCVPLSDDECEILLSRLQDAARGWY